MIIKRFLDQVEKRPWQVAIKSGENTLTYDALNKCSNQLGRIILQNASCQKKIAALLMGQNQGMIIGILGVLKAGWIYCPFDPNYPTERLEYMIKDSSIGLIITDDENMGMALQLKKKSNGSISIINILDCFGTASKENLNIQVIPSDNAYILYTSGSSGKPKGVLQTHANILYYTNNWCQRFSVTGKDRITLLASFSHDGAVPDIYSSLLSGATLFPCDIKRRMDISSIGEWLTKESITIWHSVPTLYRYFINTLNEKESLDMLRLIILGGEAVTEYDIIKCKEKFPKTIFGNIYGQTESTVNSIWLVSPDETFDKVLIGETINNTEIIIIDKDGNEVEELDSGEIVIATPFVSAGYLNDPFASESSFCEDEEFGKLYWTGDMGRLLPGGDIEILGRADSQVKIRGFRIEPGEIETALLKHPKIDEAIVLARKKYKKANEMNLDNDSFLCAYLVLSDEVKNSDLRLYLAEILPDYMIPTFFIPMEKMPLTPTGKTDRKALPEPGVNTEDSYVQPRNALEEKLVEIWAQALELDEIEIGIDSNFFDLGGHSLKAVTLLSKIHKELQVEIPINEMFQSPTIRTLSEIIKKKNKHKYGLISAAEKRDYYPLTVVQKKVFGPKIPDDYDVRLNMSRLYIIRGPFDTKRFERAMKKLIQRHESLRTSFHPMDDDIIQRIHDQVEFKVELQTCSEEYAKKQIENFIKPFNLAKPPLIRIEFLQTEEEKYYLLFETHHVIFDATSMAIMVKEVMEFYGGIEYQPLEIQFKDYALWQNAIFSNGGLQKYEDYWLDKMKGFTYTQLPFDKKNLMKKSECKIQLVDLDQTYAEKIGQFCKTHNITRFSLLLGIFKIIIAQETQQKDISVGARISSRNHYELNSLMGFLLDKILIRSIIDPEDTCLTTLAKVNRTVSNGLEYSLYPFDYLRKKLLDFYNIEDDRLVSIIINYLPPPEEEKNPIDPSELTTQFEVVNIDTIHTKYDIDLIITDSSQGVSFKVVYRSHLFSEDMIQGMFNRFGKIITKVWEDAFIKVNELG